jgi:hypothetical protein
MTGTLREDLCTFMIISLRILLRKRNILDGSCTGCHSAHFCSVTFPVNLVVNEIPWKNLVEPDRPQMTMYNTALGLCMLDNEGYRHALRICNTYYFSTATIVTRTRLIVTFIRKLPVLLCGYENKSPAAWQYAKSIEHVWCFNPLKCIVYCVYC